MLWTNLIVLGDAVDLNESRDGSDHEHQADNGSDDGTDDLEPLEPGLSAPADGLEHAPKAMQQVQPQGDEPDDVQKQDPPFTESDLQEQVGIVLEIADAEHLGKLHLGPEMCEMESDETQDDQAEDNHILGGPGVGRSLAGHLITVPPSTGLQILHRKPDAIQDVDKESKRKDGHHDGNESRAHEVTTELEKAVPCGEKLFVSGNHAVLAVEGIDDREEIDGRVQQKENDKESTTDALDEFLSDGGVEYEHFLRI